MGATHALSAAAAFLALVAFVPGFLKWAGFNSVAVVILAGLVLVGWSLFSDLDNSASTAKSSLGIFGHGLSFLLINSSRVIQTVVRTSRDDPDPNPHRGFWHTIPAALLLGFLTFLATSIPGSISLPFYGEVSFSWLIAFLICGISVHLALAGLFNSAVKKVRKGSAFGEIIAFGIALVLTGLLFNFIPKDESFAWLSLPVFLGVVAHILGDAFTTDGVPLFFPLSYFMHRKFWWKTRFTKMHAGGPAEKFVMIPLFGLLLLISVAKIFHLF